MTVVRIKGAPPAVVNTGIHWVTPWLPARYHKSYWDEHDSPGYDALVVTRFGYRNGHPGFRSRRFWRGKPCGRQGWQRLVDEEQLRTCIEREPAWRPTT